MKRLLAASLALATCAGSAQAELLVVGHRGTGSNKPGNPYIENTVPSIEKGFAEGADFVEIDAQLEAGDQVILWHDDDLTAAGLPGLRSWDRFLDTIPDLKAASGKTAKVPTLEQALGRALQLAKGPVAMDIELKLVEGQERRWIVQEIARVILKLGAQRKVIVTSFDLDSVRLMERVIPGIQTGFLTDHPSQGWELLEKVLADSREPRIEWILTTRDFSRSTLKPAALAQKAGARNVKAGVWTVNDPAEAKTFEAAGFQMVITDDPDRIR